MKQGGTNARQYMLWAFKMTGCMDCGFRPQNIDDLKSMHCDHRDPATKDRSSHLGLLPAGSLSAVTRSNNERLLDELWKCDPVCQDCHKVRTRTRQKVGTEEYQLSLPMREWIRETTREW